MREIPANLRVHISAKVAVVVVVVAHDTVKYFVVSEVSPTSMAIHPPKNDDTSLFPRFPASAKFGPIECAKNLISRKEGLPYD